MNKNRGIKPRLLNFQILPIQFPQQRVWDVFWQNIKPEKKAEGQINGKIAMLYIKLALHLFYRSTNYSLKSQIQLLVCVAHS